MSCSAKPSLRYSVFGSEPALANGNTATESVAGRPRSRYRPAARASTATAHAAHTQRGNRRGARVTSAASGRVPLSVSRFRRFRSARMSEAC
jgi:hypothetical protein